MAGSESLIVQGLLNEVLGSGQAQGKPRDSMPMQGSGPEYGPINTMAHAQRTGSDPMQKNAPPVGWDYDMLSAVGDALGISIDDLPPEAQEALMQELEEMGIQSPEEAVEVVSDLVENGIPAPNEPNINEQMLQTVMNGGGPPVPHPLDPAGAGSFKRIPKTDREMAYEEVQSTGAPGFGGDQSMMQVQQLAQMLAGAKNGRGVGEQMPPKNMEPQIPDEVLRLLMQDQRP